VSSPVHPERLGRYEVLLPIASGGMATVYLARATGIAGFEREVALKLTHAHLRDEPGFVTALIDEARFAGRIRHPNVVSVLDVAESPEGVFIVMDYVEGDSLAGMARALQKRGERIPIEISLRILDEMLAGLHAAHELTDANGAPLELVHRDVTPHNVLVGIDGVSRLTDFGVARATRRLTKTSTGLVKGKIAYMSPEQARGAELDRTCDVWAAGIVAWELFSGTRVHDGLNDAALLYKIVREAPMPLRHVRADIPRELDRVVGRALSLDPLARFASADEFAQALSEAARNAYIAPADSRAIKSFVQPLCADRLASRARKVARIASARAQRRRERGPVPAVVPFRQGEEGEFNDTTTPYESRDSLPPESTQSVSNAAGATVWDGPQGSAPRGTVTTGVEIGGSGGFRSAAVRPRTWLLAAIAPIAIIALLLALLAFGGRGRSGSNEAPEPAAELPIETTAAPAAPPPAPDPAEIVDDSEIPILTPSSLPEAPEPARAPRRPHGKPAPKSAPAEPPSVPAPSEPVPLENPYPKKE
jgi:serine/threonine-protein kinase